MKFLTIPLGLLFFSVGCLTAEEMEENTYTNPTVGFTLTKPESWHWVTKEDVSRNLERVKLSDEEFQEKMAKHATAPLVAMMKHPEPYKDLNPSIKVNIKPLGGFHAKDSRMILSLLIKPFPKVFKKFKIAVQPRETKLGGLPAAYTKIYYSLENKDGKIFPTCSELWIVPRGDFYFMIGSGTRVDEKSGKRSEIKKILESLNLDLEESAEEKEEDKSTKPM